MLLFQVKRPRPGQRANQRLFCAVVHHTGKTTFQGFWFTIPAVSDQDCVYCSTEGPDQSQPQRIGEQMFIARIDQRSCRAPRACCRLCVAMRRSCWELREWQSSDKRRQSLLMVLQIYHPPTLQLAPNSKCNNALREELILYNTFEKIRR